MANINVPTLPVDGSEGQYGPYCVASTTRIGSSGSHYPVGRTFASTDPTLDIRLDSLDPVVLPYVNAWLRAVAAGVQVEKYWRTKEYRLIGAKAATKVVTPRAEKAKPAPVAATVPVATVPVAVAVPVIAPTIVVEPNVATSAVPVLTTPLPAPAKKVSAKKVKHDGETYVQVGDITVPAADFDTFTDAVAAVAAGQVASIVITGPSGTAKTLLVEAFAAHVGMPFVKVDGGNVRSADDWFGTLVQDPNTRVWSWHWNAFGSALLNGDACIVLLDEANRAENAAALNAVMGLLDSTGSAYVPAAMTTVRKPLGMLVVATANKGAEYVGTVPFDAAVTQRFGHGVRLTYLPPKVEASVIAGLTGVDPDIATRLVAMASQQRGLKDDVSQFPSGVGVSTRMLVDIANRVVRSKTSDPRPAIRSNFNAQFEDEDEKALLNVLDTHFPLSGNDTLDVDTSSITEG